MISLHISYMIGLIVFAYVNGLTVKIALDELNPATPWRHFMIFMTFSAVGTLLFVLYALVLLLVATYSWVIHTLQIKFWWKFYIIRSYDNLTEDRLKKLIHNAKMKFGVMKQEKKKMRWMDWNYLRGVKAVRKKYKKEEHPDWKWVDVESNFLR